ncbi:MAG: NrdH-redoxin [Candidatus Omnitrophica bacterium]|nr:NrdH-redoxin [Candidatus Omnitrophota bacterium]
MKQVEIYSSGSCPHCRKLKKLLEDNNVEFVEHDVASGPEKVELLRKKTGRTAVPVIDVAGVVVIGYDEKKVKKLLGIPV